ncbi:GGDEF/EAL domain-containing response regulator [Vreelandella salicampi]|uniref:EAL domain-containing protein n=1 Tax=Vreelandella salicampi TaxID=1449798 RepID=A0A7Z0RUG5_9GAMM|nr:EAL domain-containing protein [Halomonas salicampi]NYS60190.1 EAL domain-containing protein [Halomonas salicampi]
MNVANKHLLVVDDNPVNVELMLDLLDEHGFGRVQGISDPRQVLDYCQEQLPDLLLLDIRMPHLDGYALMEQLREHFAEQTPPIIILTAQIDDATRRRALAMGVRDFLTKPFKHDEVLQRIRNTLSVEHRYYVRDQQAETLERMVEKRTRELDRQSRTDPITQLPNRRGLTQALREASISGHGAGLLFIALDGLDDVVRLHGYSVAEKLLRQLGQTLLAQLDDTHTLGLWGGSELLLLSPESEPDTLNALASRLLACFDHDQDLDDLLLNISARIGISWANGYFEGERLVHMASISLPHSEGLRVQCYSETLEAQQRHRLNVQNALRGATDRGEMSLVFQPKLSLKELRITGAEALLRWKHPEMGHLSPGLFIPLAEASGDILAIGEWVLEQSILQAAAWQHRPWISDDFHIAVNVATRQLARPHFAHMLLARMAEHRVPHRLISIEVTESGLMRDIANARHQLAQLIEAGISVAIDDFGTGHSSLAYLKTLPISTLKIDRAFVMDLEESDTDRELARTITQLAHAVDCDVVAEGIETAAQAAYLRSIGCEMAQGYFYSRPLPAADFAHWCAHWVPQATTPHHHPLTHGDT